ncbi:MAG TPA: substrate-binding domain-containing protein [Gemmatimonadales bacterium]
MRGMNQIVMVLAALVLGAGRVAAQDGFVVIVNEASSVTELTADDLSRLFLKRTTQWDNGQTVVPIDQSENTDARARFSDAVHGKSVSAIKAFWQRQIFSGRGVPPVEKASDREVIAYARANPNAIGYVAPGSALAPGVRAIRIIR